MIEVYGDLSGSSTRGMYVAACYIGTDTSWVAADTRWKRMLDFAKVDHFHATDFFATPPRGAFRGWDPESPRYLRVETMATEAAVSEGLIGFARAVDAAGFPNLRAELDKSKGKQRVQSLRLFTTLLCFEEIALYIRQYQLPRYERIAVRFEREKGAGEIPAFFKWAKKRRAGWAEGVIDVTLGDKSERPLQIADLLAHQSWNRVRDVIRHGKSHPPRRAFQRMLNGETIKVDYSTEADCIGSLGMIREFFKAHPEGIIAPPHPGRRP